MRVHPLLFFPLSLAIGASVYASSYTFSMSGDTTRFDYAETEGGQLLDTETNNFGAINGFTLSLEPSYQGFYITTSYSSGDTDYIGGTTIDPTYGSFRTTTHNEIVDYSAGFKTTTLLDRYGEVEMPFKIGLGYREWERDIQGTDTVLGVKEIYDWGYLDIGIGLHFALSPDSTLGIDASYREAFNAQMRENIYGNTFDLNDVHGYKITVPLEIVLNRSMSAFFQYNYEYWNISESNVVDGWYEPDSETKNQTLSAGLKFWF
ncbi:MAG TPA: hypothetical protein VFX57_02955 [Sulfuricurvum sp.]|nr:hypothetical protein [Sulfuricurvum sp.]